MGSTEARFKGSYFEGSAEQHHEEEVQNFSLKVGRYHTFVAGLSAKIIGYRNGIQPDSSVVTFYEIVQARARALLGLMCSAVP